MEAIPSDWLDTLDSDSQVIKWRSDSGFDQQDIAEQLGFIYRVTPEAFGRMIGDAEHMPQSFAHWWCYARLSRRNGGPSIPKYPLITKWSALLAKYHSKLLKGHVTDFTVISVLKTWLEQLYVDSLLFQDDGQRWNVPRLYGDIVLSNSRLKNMSTRSETCSFIQKLGYGIFKERGFKEGEQYWSNVCERYNVS